MCSRGAAGGVAGSAGVGGTSGTAGAAGVGAGCAGLASITLAGGCAGGVAQAHNSAARPISKPCRNPRPTSLPRILTIPK